MNLRKLFLPLCSVALCLQSYAQDKSFLKDMLWYIDNPSVFEKGQEEGHAWHMPEKSMLLNGTWKFFWCDTPEGIPAHFFNPEFPDKQWGDIKVPSNWEMQGYGDKLFRNVSAPFGVNPPHAPKEYNPTGLYRRTFKVPASWAAKDQIFLRFEKVASASFVWVNGHEVGYNEGAQEPAEYNITPYLKPGENTLAICVYFPNSCLWPCGRLVRRVPHIRVPSVPNGCRWPDLRKTCAELRIRCADDRSFPVCLRC